MNNIFTTTKTFAQSFAKVKIIILTTSITVIVYYDFDSKHIKNKIEAAKKEENKKKI